MAYAALKAPRYRDNGHSAQRTTKTGMTTELMRIKPFRPVSTQIKTTAAVTTENHGIRVSLPVITVNSDDAGRNFNQLRSPFPKSR